MSACNQDNHIANTHRSQNQPHPRACFSDRRNLLTAAVSCACMFGNIGDAGTMAFAATLSPEQGLVAEAWRLADNLFVDRTFSSQDWFSLREKMVKQKYASSRDAYDGISSMLKSLNDKYTYFLTPSEYDTLYNKVVFESQQGQAKKVSVSSSMQSVGGTKVGYVRIDIFSTTVLDEVKAALSSLAGAKAYVLDLRGNPGGAFEAGIDVARLFLRTDTDMTYRIDSSGKVEAITTFEDGPYLEAPLILLVDDGTGSSAEVFSACLQETGRAKLVGSKQYTYGKAVIQTLMRLSDGSAVRVTTAKYQTPKKNDINKRGIEVDVVKDCPTGAAAVACVASEFPSKL